MAIGASCSVPGGFPDFAVEIVSKDAKAQHTPAESFFTHRPRVSSVPGPPTP